MQIDMDEPRTLNGIRGAAIFYLLAYVLSWSIWGTFILISQIVDFAPLLIMLGAYGPLFAALILNRVGGGRGAGRKWFRSVFRWRLVWRWIVLGGLLLPLLIALVHLALYRSFVGSFALSTDPPWYWAVSVVPVNVLVLAWFSSAVEEFGWQGFALPRLTEQMHPLMANLLHGVLWATWHLPLYLSEDWSGNNQAIWLLYGITLSLAPMMYWLTRRANGSVVPAVLLHAATNLYSDLYEGEDVFAGSLADSFVAIKTGIYVVIALILIAATRSWLGSNGTVDQ